MANRNVNILLTLRDRFTPQLRGSTEEIRRQRAEINRSSRVINSWGSSANKTFKSVMGTAGKLAGALVTLGGAISVAGIVNFANEAIEGFNAAQEAETKLEAVLKNVPSIMSQGADAAANAKNNLVALTDAMEENGVVAGDVAVAGLQQLATFQLSEESLKTLAPGMADLLAQQKGLNATQEDAVSIGNMIGKVMSGQTGALTRAGIIMSEYQEEVLKNGTEMEKTAMLAKVLEQNVGGVNEALAQTDAGKIAIAGNLIGRASDTIGEKLMSVKGQMADLLIQYIPQIQAAAESAVTKIDDWITNNRDTIQAAFEKIMEVGPKVFEALGNAIRFVIDHSNIFLPILSGIAGAFASFNVITPVIGAFKNLGTVIKGATSAGGILKAFFAANPFGLVAVAIGAVITVVTLLIANWDKVKATVKTVVEKVVGFVSTLKDAFVQLGTTIKDKIVGAFNFVVAQVKKPFQWIEDKVNFLKEGFSNIGGKVKEFFGFGGTSGHATGTPYFQGGATRINEGGRGEIVNLPNGTQIIPHDVSTKMGGGYSVTVNLTVQGNLIGNRQYMEQTGDYIAQKILAAQGVV